MSDDASREILSERAVVQLPLSAATSIAIESSLGMLEEAGDVKPPVLDRDLLLLNVSTLYRNLIGAVPTELRDKLTPYTLAETLAAEMRTIEALIAEGSEGRCLTIFYRCTYSSLMRKFTKGIPKITNTVLQKQSAALEYATLGELTDNIVSKPPIDVHDIKFPYNEGKTLLLSHYPIDLLNRFCFSSLSLLESHTGAIKPPQVWYTKLNGGQGLDIIPFDRMTMQLFGDKVHFLPMHIKIRKLLYNIAVKNNWTSTTTKDMVIHSVVKNRDPALEVLVKDLYRH